MITLLLVIMTGSQPIADDPPTFLDQIHQLEPITPVRGHAGVPPPHVPPQKRSLMSLSFRAALSLFKSSLNVWVILSSQAGTLCNKRSMSDNSKLNVFRGRHLVIFSIFITDTSVTLLRMHYFVAELSAEALVLVVNRYGKYGAIFLLP